MGNVPFQISLAAARVNAGMTQEDVAKIMHVSKQTVVNWEKGSAEPSLTRMRKMSEIFKIPMDYIFLPCKSN